MGNPIFQKIVGGAFASLFVKVGAAGFQFLLFLALANAMSSDDFGLLGFGFSIATMLAVAGSFGQRMLTLKNIQIYLSDGREDLMRGVLRIGVKIVCVGTVILGIISCALLGVVRTDLTFDFLAAVAFFGLSIALAEYFAFVLRGYEKIMLALAPRDIIWRVLIILLSLPAIFGLMNLLPATLVIWVMGLSLCGIVLIQIHLFEKTRLVEIFTKPASFERKKWRKSAIGLWGVSVIQVAAPNVTVIILGLLFSPEETGPIFAALRIALLLNLVLLAANMASSPFVARLFHEKALQSLQKICSTIALVATVTSLICLVILIIWGKWILGLFGEGFDSAYLALLIASVAYVVNTATGPSSVLLEVSGHERAAFVRLTAVNTIAIALMPLGAWLASFNGVAFCLALSIVGWNVSAVLFARKHIGVDPSIFGITKLKRRS